MKSKRMQVRSAAPPLLGRAKAGSSLSLHPRAQLCQPGILLIQCLHLIQEYFLSFTQRRILRMWITFLFNYENHGHSRDPLRWLTALQAVGRSSNEKGFSYTTTAGEVCQKLLLLKTKCSCETDSLGLSKYPQKQKLIIPSWRDKYGFPLFTT